MLPLMYANSAKVTEDESAPVTMEFKILLTSAATETVTVDYATSDDPGSGKAGVDYTPASGTLIIPVGATSGTIDVQVLPNAAATFITTFYLSLSNATGVAKLVVPKLSGLIYNTLPEGR